MALNETLFPLEISRLNARPVWNTTIVVGGGGHEMRNANWQDVLYKYNAGFNIKTYADIDVLHSFFNVVRGMETAFLLKAYDDFEVSSWTEVTESVTASEKTYQLFRPYVDALANSYNRNITRLPSFAVLSTAVALIYDRGGGGEVTPSAVASSPTAETEFSWDESTGLVTYQAPGTSTLEFKVTLFYVPVRFDVDELPIDMMNYWVDASAANKANVQVPDIPMMEVRE